jgi:hypothetical protein
MKALAPTGNVQHLGPRNDEVKRFGIFGAVAMAGLKRAKLPDALRSRTIDIPMDRALKSQKEGIRKFRERTIKGQYKKYRDDLAEFCSWAEGKINLDDDVEYPEGLGDRDEDAWEILLAIARVAGDDWHKRAFKAAQWFACQRASQEEDDLGIILLRDCKEILESDKTAEPDWLRQQLFNKEGSPWGAWNLTTYQLRQKLGDLYIKPKTVRVSGKPCPVKGYHLNEFENALLKYAVGDSYSGYNGYNVDNKNNEVTEVTEVTEGTAPAPASGDADPFDQFKDQGRRLRVIDGEGV